MHSVTVVIPTYKRRERVGQAIESALAQPGVRCQVIVVIDDLCMETRALAESYGDRVEVIFNERNRGASFSRNQGLARTTTRFVMFLDSDDHVEGPLLSGLCDAMAKNAADVGFGPTIGYNEISGQRSVYPALPNRREEAFAEWLLGHRYVPPCSVLWNASFLRSIEGWDEELDRNDDAEISLRALIMGAITCFSQQGAGVYVHHGDPNRISRSKNYESNLRCIQKLLERDGTAIPRATVERVSAVALYEIARLAFQIGNVTLGEKALTLSRRYGFTGHRGPALSRALSNVVGLRNTQRIRSLLVSADADRH